MMGQLIMSSYRGSPALPFDFGTGADCCRRELDVDWKCGYKDEKAGCCDGAWSKRCWNEPTMNNVGMAVSRKTKGFRDFSEGSTIFRGHLSCGYSIRPKIIDFEYKMAKLSPGAFLSTAPQTVQSARL